MRYILTIVAFVILGCSTKISYIFVDEPKVKPYKKVNYKLALKDIKLPFYLKDGKIPYVKDNKIDFFKNTYFADDAEDFVTNRALKILEKSLCLAKVYHYPWITKDTNYILEININKFITKNNKLTLKAKYILFDKNKHIKKSKSYTYTKNIQTISSKNIVQNMKELFDKFLQNVAKDITSISKI